MKVSYLVTVKDEIKEIQQLITQLLNNKEDEDEIVVLQDTTISNELQYSETDDFHRVNFYLHDLDKEQKIKMTTSVLRNDFASFKNFGKSQCKGDYILQIDADEIVSNYLLENIKTILSMNPDIELYWLPRINIVNGLTTEWSTKWGWRLTYNENYSDPLINWPDYQSRLFKNVSNIKWVGKVHEILTGAILSTHFPAEIEYAIYHEKDIDRQIKQNEHYSKIVR
ncbi:MAG: hypothetical protein JETCAE03_32610 [Ignavibacteriaceae bacterium]|jgi:glycosyltransferase involved in cell wall biosynthesis|nr:MAG: hypothetical protein JETCAE03_32610 [Ignavibacteriaceae bacterium]